MSKTSTSINFLKCLAIKFNSTRLYENSAFVPTIPTIFMRIPPGLMKCIKSINGYVSTIYCTITVDYFHYKIHSINCLSMKSNLYLYYVNVYYQLIDS